MKLKTSKEVKKQGWKRQRKRMNPVSLIINWMNPMSLMGQIVYLSQLYSKDK